MSQAKEIRGRINSIKNTQKTTKAMELIAGAKMRKAIDAAVKTRAYSEQLRDIMARLQSRVELAPDSPVYRSFAPAAAGGITLIIALTSNRGLCGGYNSSVVKLVSLYVEEHPDETVQVVALGKKGSASCSSLGIAVIEAYEKLDSARDDASVLPIAAGVSAEFQKTAADRVLVAYSHFESALVQAPRLQQLLPITGIEAVTEDDVAPRNLTAFEPSPVDVLEYLVPRLVESQLYQALLDSNAAEHSSRRIAMKNATDAAGEMKNALTLAYNRARQAAITQEIAEIAAGTAAVS